MLNVSSVMGIGAVLIYTAFYGEGVGKGRALGVLLLVAALPFILYGALIYDAVKIHRQKSVSWSRAFSLANNKPAELRKDKREKS